MPNSAPKVKKEMLDALGIDCVEDIYRDLIPKSLRLPKNMELPTPIRSEAELKRHMDDLLAKNKVPRLNFLGAGCYRHYVPAVCDEINSRAEFLTAYVGDTYSDHGKMQAIFEYASLMAELLDMDAVSYPTFDESQAVASCLRMAMRITGRSQILLPASMHPEVFSQINDYCKYVANIQMVNMTPNGMMDLADLKTKLSYETAAVLVENPSYLGFIEIQGQAIADLVHDHGALFIVDARPTTLGVLAPPAHYGADMVCGDIQPMGMHIQFGGGHAGYIAVPHDEKFIREIPTYLYGIAETKTEKEYGWGRALNERTSHGSREKAKEYFGTGSALWAITTAVYLASMGPKGLQELGETIMQRTAYAQTRLSQIPGLNSNVFRTSNFQEFVVNFDQTGWTVNDVNNALLTFGIAGGKDLSWDFPDLGQSALYCITDLTTADDIECLVDALICILSPGGCKHE
jgi:glycine dehydrogenase subunit 1